MKRFSLAIWAVATTAGACSSPSPPPNVSCDIRVLDHLDEPVSGASIAIDGVHIGATNDQGRLQAVLSGPQGRTARAHVDCPEQWTPVDSPDRILKVRFLEPILSGDHSFVPLSAVFRCQPRLRPQVLVVRADGRGGIPVVILGQTVAHTDKQGVAQLVVEEEPGSEIEVVLDTSDSPKLCPAMPRRRFTVPAVSQILIFDQKFQERRHNKRRPRRRRSPGPRRL